jgi:hypothetical protein
MYLWALQMECAGRNDHQDKWRISRFCGAFGEVSSFLPWARAKKLYPKRRRTKIVGMGDGKAGGAIMYGQFEIVMIFSGKRGFDFRLRWLQ